MRNIPLNPAGWLLLVASLGVYAVSTFSGSRVDGDPRADRREAYTWPGGTLILENVQRDRQITCTVTPNAGATVDVQLLRRVPGAKLRRYDELTPWFTGSASLTCTGDVRARTGSSASLYKFVNSAAFRVGAPLLVAAPLVVAFAFCRRQPVA